MCKPNSPREAETPRSRTPAMKRRTPRSADVGDTNTITTSGGLVFLPIPRTAARWEKPIWLRSSRTCEFVSDGLRPIKLRAVSNQQQCDMSASSAPVCTPPRTPPHLATCVLAWHAGRNKTRVLLTTRIAAEPATVARFSQPRLGFRFRHRARCNTSAIRTGP